MADWKLERAPSFDGYNVEWARPGRLILSNRNSLYEAVGPGAPIRPLVNLGVPLLQSALSRIRSAQRLLRFSFYNVAELEPESFFLSFGVRMDILRDGVLQPLLGLLRPSRILRNACAVDGDGDLYFGEYIRNAGRGPVHIYRLPAGASRLEVAYRFESGEIRHVHGIYRDPYEGGLWCLTGDRPGECRILRSFDGFRTLEQIGSGDETWRAVSIIFTREAVYYGSDAEFHTNHLYRVSRRTGARDILAQVEGPVYYSTRAGDDLFFGVTAELCPSQTDPAAVLWHVDERGVPSRVARFSKDRLPVHFFQPGTINFAGGPGLPGEVYFHGVGLTGEGTRVHRLRRDNPSTDADALSSQRGSGEPVKTA